MTIYTVPGGAFVELQARTEQDMAELEQVVNLGLGVEMCRYPDWMRVRIPVDLRSKPLQ